MVCKGLDFSRAGVLGTGGVNADAAEETEKWLGRLLLYQPSEIGACGVLGCQSIIIAEYRRVLI